MHSLVKYLSLSILAILCSCSGGNKWHIKGQIENLDKDTPVIVEAGSQGRWYPLDTLKVSSNGKFSYSREAAGYPDIYRLRVGDKALYFPIDSIETVSITATAPLIDREHTIGGSPEADRLMRVDSLINAAVASQGATAALQDSVLKRRLAEVVLSAPSDIVAYYIISKSIDGKPVFNPSVTGDVRIIGAVANAFSANRPSDPRTSYISRLYLDNRRRTPSAPGEPIYAREISAFEIKLFDNEGKEHSLLEETARGKVVILNFTAYGAQESPAFNVALNKVYEKYAPQGLEIFQVSVDPDEYIWKQTARNLPWITVLAGTAERDKVLRDYNVTAIPTIFLFNRQGELVSRVNELSELDSSVARLL